MTPLELSGPPSTLPPGRRMWAARTWSQRYEPRAVEIYRRPRHNGVGAILFACLLGVSGAAVLFCWWSS